MSNGGDQAEALARWAVLALCLGAVAVEALVILTLAAGQASMLLSFWRDDDSPLVNQALFGSLAVLGLLGVLTIVEVSDPSSDVSLELFAILSVLYLLCALLPPLLRRAELDG